MFYHIVCAVVVCIVAAVGCNDDAARVGGESVVDVRSWSSSSSIQGLYIPGGKFVLCSVCLPFYIVYNYCFTILYVRLFVLLQQLVVMAI